MNTPYWVKHENNKEVTIEKRKALPYWIFKSKSNEKFNYTTVTDTINRISSFCFPPDLADKIIIARYKQFRTPREEINELIVKNIKLCVLSRAEIEKYLEAVKHIWRYGEREDQVVNKINNIDIDAFQINIDLVGFSLELANLLGLDYLKGNYVITSVKQRECDILRNYTSFDSQIINIFNNYSLDQILLGESLIGTFKSDIRSIIKNPESIFDIEINFDTPTCAISKLKKIKDCEKRFLSDTSLIKNRKFLDGLYTDIEQIIAKHGSIDRLDVEEIKFKDRLESCKFTFCGENRGKNRGEKGNIYLYCLKGKIPIFIYFSDFEIESGNNVGNVNNEIRDIRRDDFILLNGSNTKTISVIEVLISEGIVGYSPYLGLERASAMIIRKRKDILKDLLDKNPESPEELIKLFSENVSEDIPEKAKQLLMAVKKVKDGEDILEIGDIAIYMTFPLIQNDTIYELLSRIENPGIKPTYINTEKFIEKVLKMDDNELKIFLRSLLESLEFREEYNIVANAWLKENRKKVCEDIGVGFKDA